MSSHKQWSSPMSATYGNQALRSLIISQCKWCIHNCAKGIASSSTTIMKEPIYLLRNLYLHTVNALYSSRLSMLYTAVEKLYSKVSEQIHP